MSEQIFECDPSGWVLMGGDECRVDNDCWRRLDRLDWQPVAHKAHYYDSRGQPRRLHGNMGADGKIAPIGRFVDHTATPHYRLLAEAERAELGLDSAPAPVEFPTLDDIVAHAPPPKGCKAWEEFFLLGNAHAKYLSGNAGVLVGDNGDAAVWSDEEGSAPRWERPKSAWKNADGTPDIAGAYREAMVEFAKVQAMNAPASVAPLATPRPRAVFNWEVEKDGHGIRGWRLCVDRIECVGGAIGPRDQFQVAFIAIGERGTFTATVNDRAVGRNSLHETKEYVRTALGIPAEDIEEESK